MNTPSFDSTDVDCPPHVLDRIASDLLEEIDRFDGDLDAVDVAALHARYPDHAACVDRQITEVRALHPGNQTVGRYELGKMLGRGGFGIVKRAHDTVLDRPVALKILRNPLLSQLEEFREEAQVAARLGHRNIVSIYDFIDAEGFIGIAMELVEGASLDRIIATARGMRGDGPIRNAGQVTLAELISTTERHGGARQDGSDRASSTESPTAADAPLPIGGTYFRDAAGLLSRIADALAKAHALNVVHRDVKPPNILVQSDGTPKLADFGLAKALDRKGFAETVGFKGSPFYASPEQVEVKEIGPATDVWSLGVTLYEMVTLRVPFAGTTREEILAAIRKAPLIPPRRLNPRIPNDLEQIILKCLEREPGFRYPTMDALAADLRAFADGEFVAVRPVSRFRRAWVELRRGSPRTVAVLLVMVGLAFGLGLAINLALHRWAQSQRQDELVAEAAMRLQRAIDDPRRGAKLLADARDAARRALLVDPADQRTRAEVLRVNGRAAFEERRFPEAAIALQRAQTLGARFGPEDGLVLARAALATRKWDLARAAYAHPLVRRPDELRLLNAFARGATSGRLPFPVSRAFPATQLEGLGPSFVIFEERSSHSTHLRIYEISSGRTGKWTVQDPSAAGGLEKVAGVGLFDLDGDGRDEVYTVGVEKPPTLPGEDPTPPNLWVARGPFGADTGPRWRSMPTPGVVVGDECWIVGFPKAEGRPAMTVLNRARSGARVWLDDDGAHLHSAWNWTWRSDLEMLHATTFGQRPALLRCQGPWTDWDVHLDVPGPLGHLVSTASATPGAVRDAQVVRVDDREYVIATNGASETYLSHFRFGFATPYGWPFGIQVMEVDQATRQLIPVTRLRLPRPTHSGSRILLADVLPSQPGPEVLLFDRHDVKRQHTLVASLRHDDEGRITLEPRLHLPGCVCAVVDVDGKKFLCVSWDEESASLVELEP